jgi:hypothetical protein
MLQSEKLPTPNIRLFTDAAGAGTDELNQVEYFRQLRQFRLDAGKRVGDGETFAKEYFESLS